MKENCANCNTDYEYDKDSCQLNLFIEDPACNHIATKCPHCGQDERVYAHAETFLHVMNELGAGLSLHARADDDLKKRAELTWTSEEGPTDEVEPELPELPVAWRVALYDDLRNWKGVVE